MKNDICFAGIMPSRTEVFFFSLKVDKRESDLEKYSDEILNLIMFVNNIYTTWTRNPGKKSKMHIEFWIMNFAQLSINLISYGSKQKLVGQKSNKAYWTREDLQRMARRDLSLVINWFRFSGASF